MTMRISLKLRCAVVFCALVLAVTAGSCGGSKSSDNASGNTPESTVSSTPASGKLPNPSASDCEFISANAEIFDDGNSAAGLLDLVNAEKLDFNSLQALTSLLRQFATVLDSSMETIPTVLLPTVESMTTSVAKLLGAIGTIDSVGVSREQIDRIKAVAEVEAPAITGAQDEVRGFNSRC